MPDRNPYDGLPYYCTFCGMGLSEYHACEDVRCVLETNESSHKRMVEAAEKIIGADGAGAASSS